MGRFYQRLLRQGIDLAPLGVERSAENAAYFCTPKGASIIGWAGVDGIHYCFIRGFGEMVFAVSPANAAPDYVHPLAADFADFLRLLLSCGDAAALEQAWMWDEAQFGAFLRRVSPAPAQQAVLTEITDTLGLAPMEHPWRYIRQLQDSFDYSKIKYTADFYDPDMNPAAVPESPAWKVFWGGSFWGRGQGRPGRELPVGKSFSWAGRQWLVPGVYVCGQGLVVDFCMQADPAQLKAFLNKWSLYDGDGAHSLSREQKMELELENPLQFDLTPSLVLNGAVLPYSHGCAICYSPCLPEGEANPPEVRWAMDHYGLDDAYGWLIWRFSFPWNTKRPPKRKALSVLMSQERQTLPGPHFRAAAPGDTFDFLHPRSGVRHTLTVQSCQRQELPESCFRHMPDWESPAHCLVMAYTVTPELPEGALTVCDCAENDPPREKAGSSPSSAEGSGAAAVIGGADGPTVVLFSAGGERSGVHTACSALHFQPVQDVEWRMIFHEKAEADMTVELL